MSAQIEHGVSMPPDHRTATRMGRLKAVLLSLAPGDSFRYRSRDSAAPSVRRAARGLGMTITVRRVDAETVRIWRVDK